MLKHTDHTLALASVEIAPKLVSWRAFNAAPSTLAAVKAHFVATGKMGVSDAFSPKRLFGTAHACQAFDAWHDFSHVRTDGAFDIPGETLVDDMQQAELMDWARDRSVPANALRRASAVLRMNNIGRLEFWKENDGPPNDVRSFAFGYLTSMGLINPVDWQAWARNEFTEYTD